MQVIVFDTETTDLIRNTGLPLSKQPKCIELFARKIQIDPGKWGNSDDWDLISEFDSLFNPGMPISEEVFNITGINDEMVRDAPKASERWEEIEDFFGSADAMVAHNLSYDQDIMQFEAQRAFGRKMALPKRKICTVESTVHLKGHRMNLQDLHQHLFGEGFEKAHRARNDVNALDRCFRKLWQEDMI